MRTHTAAVWEITIRDAYGVRAVQVTPEVWADAKEGGAVSVVERVGTVLGVISGEKRIEP